MKGCFVETQWGTGHSVRKWSVQLALGIEFFADAFELRFDTLVDLAEFGANHATARRNVWVGFDLHLAQVAQGSRKASDPVAQRFVIVGM